MSISTSIVSELLQAIPHWRPQIYFKASLTALSHAMEDQVLAGEDAPLVIASFQQERYYRQEAHRYRRIARKTDQVYVLSAPETDFVNSSGVFERIAFSPEDSLASEWHLIVIGQQYATCLICRERKIGIDQEIDADTQDNSRRFEGIWTFDRQVSQKAADILLKRILSYRPELSAKIEEARQRYLPSKDPENALREKENQFLIAPSTSHPDPFVQRLVTYLQVGQYKLIKANRSLVAKEHKERLINSVTQAIRRSLDPEEILQVAVEKLGEGLGVCRCVVYRCNASDGSARIQHEFLNEGVKSIKGQVWPLKNNPLFEEVISLGESVSIDNTLKDPRLQGLNKSNRFHSLPTLVKSCSIFSWLVVPIFYQGRLLGIVELHHCDPEPSGWKSEDIALVNAIATQIGVALIQAEAYANLHDLNEQLEALDRTRSNLVAITGHELRTPLSTIQVCLESLATEPDMSPELRQVMLNTALQDAERMRTLVQDFLTLSQLESGRVQWHPEPLSLYECIELSLSHVRSRNPQNIPKIENLVSPELPLVLADGEWLVEVLSKLLDNACKFTTAEGTVTIEVNHNSPQQLEVTISDTGRGIEPNRLETVFDRFYQEEGALRRSAGGTGLGLAICRQIVRGWGGQIWAESEGKNHGSQFHFTVPIVVESFNPEAEILANNIIDPIRPTSQKRRRTSKKKK
ncbi:DICT sensory domain-containing protein [Gloeothece citriformis]|nr:DICT sensory domain-containing protein [Gloeothece citriformis]